MALNTSSAKTMETLNPCCVVWKTRYTKMEEKRRALRQGVEILKGQIDLLQLENGNLKKASEEERARLNILEEEKGKEASLRTALQKEIAALKSDSKLEVTSRNVDLDREATQLRTCISEKDVELNRLMHLLAEEITRADAEKKAAELERKNAAELRKSLEFERSKADEANMKADAAAKNAEDHRVQLETLKTDLEKTNMKWEEVNRKLEAEKQNVILEKTSSDQKKDKEDECHANDLLKQLEEEKKKVEKLQKEMQEIVSCKQPAKSSELAEVQRKLEAEKKKVAREKRHVEEEKARALEQRRISEATEKRVLEEKGRGDKLLMQLEEEKQKVAKLQTEMLEAMSSQKVANASELEELKRNLEEEKKKVAREQRRVEEEKAKALEQRRMAEAMEKRGFEEKGRADNLLLQLEEEKQKVEKLQRDLLEVCSSHKASSELDELKRDLEEEKKKVVQEQRFVAEEKVRVMEQRRIAEADEKRGSEEKYRADNLLLQLEEEKQKVGVLEREMLELLSSQKANSSELDELKRNIEDEKKKVAREQRRAEEEKARAVEQRRIAEANERRGSELKCSADTLLLQLEEEKQKVEKLQREMQEVMSSQKTAFSSELFEVNRKIKAEKKKVALERMRADLAMSAKGEQEKLAEASLKNATEEKRRADRLAVELDSSRLMIDNLEQKLKKVNDMLEAERKEVAEEKKCADTQNLISEDQGKIVLVNEMTAMEEKGRGDKLLLELENARQKLQDMEHELQEVKLCRGLDGTSSLLPAVINERAARFNLLRDQLKFEKKRVKHAEEVAKLKKNHNRVLQQELKRLKQDFQCLLGNLSMLSDIFGGRHSVPNVFKKSGPLQMDFHGDGELRMSSFSTRDATCLLKPNMQFVHAGNCEESSSGMENVLDPLRGDSPGDTLPSSTLNSNTASFSDEPLVGSQGRAAGSLARSAGLSVENTNQHATKLRCSNECFKQRNSNVGDHSTRIPVDTAIGHAKKRRKIMDEIESIKYMHLEGKSIFQEAEKKLLALHETLLQPMTNELIEKEDLSLPFSKTNICNNSDLFSQKREPLRKPELVLQRAGDSNVQMEVDKLCALDGTATRESSQPLQDIGTDPVTHNQDAMMSFTQVINGDYMKLLDLDDAAAEECFRVAMERPLSPTLPVFDFYDHGQKVGAKTPSMPVCENNEATCQPGFSAHNKNQLYFVFFSDVEDIGSLTRVFGAVKSCIARGCFSSHSNWSMQAILGVLLLEKYLRPREKVCALFSLILLNFSAVSSSKSLNFQIEEQMDSFSAHMHTVLSNIETREVCANFCDLHELLTLAEDFVVNRKIVSSNEKACELDGCGSSVEILHEGEKVFLWPKMASTNLVVAGSIVLASISKAVGHIASVCEVSPKILQIGRTEYSLALSILHTFAYICGEDYFTNSNYTSVVKVVKSVVTFMEGSLAETASRKLHSGDKHQFTPCVKCPFSEGSVTLDYVSSELLEELQKHKVPQNSAVSAHSSNREAYACFLSDVLSSLELITSIMGWDWVHDKIVPKLFKMLESGHHDSVFSTALVVLLGDIGRLGVEARGYDDTGVKGIKCQLLHLLRQTAASSMGDKTLPSAIVYGLIGLYPKGHEMLQNGDNVKLPPEEGHSASAPPDLVSKFLSSLSSQQRTTLAGLVNPDIGVAA